MRNHSKNPETANPPRWDILSLLKWTTSYFKSHNIESPRACAEILLAHALDCRRLDLYLKYDQPLDAEELAAFKALIRRRTRREPVAYIVGTRGFWSLDLSVTGDVLIPRPETECLVEKALSFLDEPAPGTEKKRILELGTGSGAIILALAGEKPEHSYFASDRSEKAVEVAARNAQSAGLADKIRFFVGDWFQPLHRKVRPFDMIVSNPPYIRTDDIPGLEPEVHAYEPMAALDGGVEGLDDLEVLIGNAHCFLDAGGRLILEMGHDQKPPVRRMFDACGAYGHVEFYRDYAGIDRGVCAQKKG